MANYVIMCTNGYSEDFDGTESEANSLADNLTSGIGGGTKCYAFANMVLGPDENSQDEITLLTEREPTIIDGPIIGTNEDIGKIAGILNLNVGSVSFTTSLKKKSRYSLRLDGSPKFSPNEFDENFVNIVSTINQNSLNLAQLITNELYQKQKLNLYDDVTTGSTTSESILWKGILATGSISTNGDVISLRSSGIFASGSDDKVLRFKINGETILSNTENINPNGINWFANIDIIKSGTQSCTTSGYILYNGQSVGNLNNTKTAINWLNSLELSITGQNETAKSGEITLSTVIVDLPRRTLAKF